MARQVRRPGGSIADLVYAQRASLPEPVAEIALPEELRRVPMALLVSIPVILLVAAGIVYRLNLVLAYNDSKAHLMIARRTFDSLAPGLAQLGTVWLPVPHLLLLPFVQVDGLYQTGLAGTLVGVAVTAYGAFSIYRLVSLWSGGRPAALVALAVYILNPNLLYIQATPLTEPIFLGFMAGAAYHFAAWIRTLSYRDLILAGSLAAVASLSRYDGWAVAAAGSIVALTLTYASTRRRDAAEAMGLSFAALACFGMLLWLVYNFTIFGDAFAWQHSVTSAAAQQSELARLGLLPAKGHPEVASLLFAWTVLDVAGAIVVLLALSGWIVEVAKPGRRLQSLGLLALLCAPIAFELLSLLLGQSAIYVPQLDPVGFFNVRYGLVALPLVAVGCGLLAAQGRRTALLAGLLAGAQVGLFAASGPPILVQDGRNGVSAAAAVGDAPALLRNRYRGGRVLVDETNGYGGGLIFDSQLNQRDFVISGDQEYWARALEKPSGQVRYIFFRDDDIVGTQMTPEKLRDFHSLGLHGGFHVYEAN